MTTWLPTAAAAAASTEGGAEFSIASYNILAQSLVRRSIFHYCSKSTLKFATRKPRLLETMRGLNADVLCLQELDFFADVFEPALSEMGYGCAYTAKAGKSHGVGIFFKRERFELVAEQALDLDALAAPQSSVERDELCRGNVALLAALRLRGDGPGAGQVVAVSNTHLFWNWRFKFTRLLQASQLLSEAVAFRAAHGADALLMAGDFNGGPDSEAYRLLTCADTARLRADWGGELLHTPPTMYDPYSGHVNGPPPEAFVDGVYEPVVTDYGAEHRARREAEVDRILAERAALPLAVSTYAGYTQADPRMREIFAECPAHGATEGTASAAPGESANSGEASPAASPPAPPLPADCACEATQERALLLTEPDTGVAVGRRTKWAGEAPYTVWGPTFRATLDYVFAVGEGVEVRALAQLPLPSQLSAEVGLPNSAHPSDHLPVGAVLSLSPISI